MMEDFPSNSKTTRAKAVVDDDNPRDIQQIVTGEVIVRKPSGFRRLRQSFIKGDASTVTEHIIWNVLIPRLQEAVADVAHGFIDGMTLGDRSMGFRGAGYSTPVGTSTSKFTYNALTSGGPLVNQGPNVLDEVQTRLSPNEIIVGSRAEAEAIIHAMGNTIEKYAAVTVADLYRMVGKTSHYMDSRWGWDDLNSENCGIKRVPRGVLIVLPVPKDLS